MKGEGELALSAFMEFKLSERSFAIPLLFVKEVIPQPETTPLPGQKAGQSGGFFNLRGVVLNLFEIQTKLLPGLTNKNQSSESKSVVIVLEQGENIFGVIVDEVTRVLQVDEKDITQPSLDPADPSSKYVSKVIKVEDRLVLIPELSKMFKLTEPPKSKAG